MQVSFRRPLALGGVAIVAVALIATGVATAQRSDANDVALVTTTTTTTTAAPIAPQVSAQIEAVHLSSATLTKDAKKVATPAPASSPRPKVLVAASEKGRLVVINTKTGKTDKVLGTFANGDNGLLGPNLSITPDGKTVYFEVRNTGGNPTSSIYSIPVAGGKETKIVDGKTPRVSPDGKSLSYFKYEITEHSDDEGHKWTNFSLNQLVVQDLASGTEKVVTDNFPCCGDIALAAWSSDGERIAAQGMQCGCGDGDGFLDLRIYDANTTNSFVNVPVPPSVNKKASWAYPSFLPNGDLFVLEIPNFIADSGTTTGATRMLIIDPTNGAVKKVITTGFQGRWYSEAVSDVSGEHLLYLSDKDLMVSDGLQRPTKLATGLIGADW